MRLKNVLYIFVALIFISCSSKDQKIKVESEYQKCNSNVEAINKILDNSSKELNEADFNKLKELSDSINFDFNEDDIDDDHTLQRYAKLKQQTIDVKQRIDHLFDDGNCKVMLTKFNVDGQLIKENKSYPVYVKKGEILYLDADMDKIVSVNIYNADSHDHLRSFRKIKEFHDSISVSFSAIYLVSVNVLSPTYVNLKLRVKTGNKESIESPVQIETESETVQKGAVNAHAVEGIQMKSFFEEPRKFTLRGQLKAMFSGSYRALVPLQVAKGTTDILYRLRISTNETEDGTDGAFKQDLDVSYHKIKFMGLPLYESHHGSGLLSTILGENVPPREEDAYINMYVFMNAAEARKFQNGVEADKLKYHLDYSTMGTQSCNGRIPAKGCKTIYLGFENERMRYNNYVWLEALSVVPHTEYVREKYIIQTK